jgi:hypothetical protein
MIDLLQNSLDSVQSILVSKVINLRTIILSSLTNIGVIRLIKVQHMIDLNKIKRELIQVIQIDHRVMQRTVLPTSLVKSSEATIACHHVTIQVKALEETNNAITEAKEQ